VEFRWPFNKTKHKQWLGINLSALVPSAVMYGPEGMTACVNFSQDEGVEALESWLKANATDGMSVVLVLDSEDYELLLAEAPNVPDDELSAAIEFRIGDLLLQPVEDTAIQTMRLPEDAYRGRMSMTHVVAVANKEINRWVVWAEKLKLKIEAITVPEMSLLNVLSANAISQGIALLELGPKKGSLRLYQDGALYLTRHVAVGIEALDLQSNISEIEPAESDEVIVAVNEQSFDELQSDDLDLTEISSDELTLDGINSEEELELNAELEESTYVGFAPKSKVNEQQVQNLILDVQRSLDYYESQLGLGQITQLWLMAGDEDLADLVAAMQPLLTANIVQPNMAEKFSHIAGLFIAEECTEINCVTIALGGALAYEPS
jgi:MSHA biogenesis protein MshI